jgi:hypothetical protein
MMKMVKVFIETDDDDDILLGDLDNVLTCDFTVKSIELNDAKIEYK